MSVSENPVVAKPRRRLTRPEQIGLTFGRVETVNLTVEVRNAAAITQLIDGLDCRIALLEEGPSLPAVQPARLPNGNDRPTA